MLGLVLNLMCVAWESYSRILIAVLLYNFMVARVLGCQDISPSFVHFVQVNCGFYLLVKVDFGNGTTTNHKNSIDYVLTLNRAPSFKACRKSC